MLTQARALSSLLPKRIIQGKRTANLFDTIRQFSVSNYNADREEPAPPKPAAQKEEDSFGEFASAISDLSIVKDPNFDGEIDQNIQKRTEDGETFFDSLCFGNGLAGFGLEPQPLEEFEDEGEEWNEETDLTDGMNEEELVFTLFLS